MTAGYQLTWSPGAGGPVYLGPDQQRVWRVVERMLGRRSSTSSTMHAIAGSTGLNAGVVSRTVTRLSQLGLIARETRLGRLGGVTLWRAVALRARGLDARRRARALRRMGVPVPGQLALASANGRAWWDTEPDTPEPIAAPVRQEPVRELEPDPDIPASTLSEYGLERCGCGRMRLTFGGRVAGPCPHDA